MKNALVTGATGFVGSNLVKGLVREGWHVGVIVRPMSSLDMLSGIEDKIDIYKITASDNMTDIVGRAKPDVVFHIASMVINEHKPDEIPALINSNITLGTELLEAMAIHGVKYLVNTSTYWEHYENKEYNPVNLYAATKRAFQDMMQFYIEAKGVRAITLKLFDIYGPKDPRPKLLNLLLNIAETGESLGMSLGEQQIDLVHIDDVVQAYLVAGQRLLDEKVRKHEIYDVRTEHLISIRDLVLCVERQTGKKLDIKWGERKYNTREMMRPSEVHCENILIKGSYKVLEKDLGLLRNL